MAAAISALICNVVSATFLKPRADAQNFRRKIATVATARKLVVIAWHLLSHGEQYAFGRPALYREKLRRIELLLGAARHQERSPTGRQLLKTAQHRAEREIAAQHERAYQRILADWRASRPPLP